MTTTRCTRCNKMTMRPEYAYCPMCGRKAQHSDYAYTSVVTVDLHMCHWISKRARMMDSTAHQYGTKLIRRALQKLGSIEPVELTGGPLKSRLAFSLSRHSQCKIKARAQQLGCTQAAIVRGMIAWAMGGGS